MCKIATVKKIVTDALTPAEIARLQDELNTHLILTQRHEERDHYEVWIEERSRKPVFSIDGFYMGAVSTHTELPGYARKQMQALI